MSTGDFTSTGEAPGADGQGFVGQAQEKAQEFGDQAQEKVQEAAEQTKGTVREQLDQRSSQVAERINEQASDLRAVSESLREQGKDGPARAADTLAEYAEKVGGYLQEKDSVALLSDVEEFGRRQPLTAGAGALAIGFAASRFLKASSSRRYSSRPQPAQGGGRPSSATVPFAPAPAQPPLPPTQPLMPADPLAPGLGAPAAGGRPAASAPSIASGTSSGA